MELARYEVLCIFSKECACPKLPGLWPPGPTLLPDPKFRPHDLVGLSPGPERHQNGLLADFNTLRSVPIMHDPSASTLEVCIWAFNVNGESWQAYLRQPRPLYQRD